MTLPKNGFSDDVIQKAASEVPHALRNVLKAAMGPRGLVRDMAADHIRKHHPALYRKIFEGGDEAVMKRGGTRNVHPLVALAMERAES